MTTESQELQVTPSPHQRFQSARPAALLAVLLLVGCASSPTQGPTGLPAGEEAPPPLRLDRSQSQEQDGVTVTLSIPTDDDVSRFFGVELAENDIQPIWIRITNTSDVDYWLLPVAIDRDYYSADEAARITGDDLSDEQQAANRAKFRANAMPFFSKAHGTTEGYVYASHMRGGRFVDVRLSGHLRAIRMRFSVLLPTEGFDYERSALRQLYAQVQDLPDLTLPQFRERLREMPCCTTNDDGSGEGDPLNVVLVGSGEEAVASLTSSGWSFTEAITIDSIRRMIGAAISSDSFLTAPVSSLYAFGRAQDIALQRGRSTISQRNHMRLWLAPFRCEGQSVWIGQVSRDIGVKVTTKSPTLTTHVIDPVVDESREYLFQSLLHHDAVRQFAFVRGVGAATEADPRHNLADDPYFTDGMRLVVWLSSTPVPPHMALDLGWNESADPAREGKGEESLVPALIDDAPR
jgi:LssY C-terminus